MTERAVEGSGESGLSLGRAGRYAEALAALDLAVAENPRSRELWFNRGVTLSRLSRHLDALLSYDRAVSLDEGFADGWRGHGNALVALQQYRAAVISYDRAQSIDPSLPYLDGAIAYTKRMLCDWDGLASAEARIAEGIRAGRPVSHMGGLLGAAIPAALQRRCAEHYIATRHPLNGARAHAEPWDPKRRRLRVGYLSGDFGNHPIGYQMLALARHHERSRIEVHALSLQSRDDSCGAQIRQAAEHFVDLGQRATQDIVQDLRSLRLDVVIDLQGHTQHGRLDLLAAGLAPLQLNYLCPSTSGAPFLDAIISDEIAIPASHEANYTERVRRVPVSSFIADYAGIDLPEAPSRASQGLKPETVVLASFAESYKITRDIWAIWMRLLARHPQSELWLGIRSVPDVAEDLRRRAAVEGLDPGRIVFATYAPSRAAHLARLALADLGLDTHLYNGHTTNADLLHAGVPVVTAPSETLCGRLGGSIVAAAGLPDLVAANLADYERMADRAISDAGWRQSLRRRLATPSGDATLFDARLAVRRLEGALFALAEEQLLEENVRHRAAPTPGS